MKKPSRNEPLLTKADVARILKVSNKTVSRLSKKGTIDPPIYLTPEMEKSGRDPRWIPLELWKRVEEMVKRRDATA